MDVSKFALDRTAYLNSAAANALYDTKASAYSSAYLDPTSMLTKAYFDSKMYQDRANYAFDISKIYGQQQGQQQGHNQNHLHNGSNLNNNNIDERDTNSQLSDSQEKGQVISDNQVDTTSMGNNNNQYGAGAYQNYGAAASASANASAQNNNGEYRRPLTVIF